MTGRVGVCRSLSQDPWSGLRSGANVWVELGPGHPPCSTQGCSSKTDAINSVLDAINAVLWIKYAALAEFELHTHKCTVKHSLLSMICPLYAVIACLHMTGIESHILHISFP